MNFHTHFPATVGDVLSLVEAADLTPTRRRDLISGTKCICRMMRCDPQSLVTNVPDLRVRLNKIHPAAHGISAKTFSNLKSLFIATLELAGVLDPRPSGSAQKDPRWEPLVKGIKKDKRKSCGLASFVNWCASKDILPDAVTDQHVLQHHDWLVSWTLCPKPNDVSCRIPKVWNEAAEEVPAWPQIRLKPLSFKPPQEHLPWDELDAEFRHDVESYLTSRAKPDLFDERPNAPRRPLAETTIRLQREHLRLAASILVGNGMEVENITSLADLVEPEAVKNGPASLPREGGGQAKRLCDWHRKGPCSRSPNTMWKLAVMNWTASKAWLASCLRFPLT